MVQDSKSGNTPENDAELRRRIEILNEEFSAGKIKLMRGSRTVESLQAVHRGPDGQIDLSTVDSLVRALALGIAYKRDRDEIKQTVSLSDIQNAYYEFIHEHFGHIYQEMVDHESNPGAVAQQFFEDSATVAKLSGPSDEFIEAIDEFWGNVGGAAQIHTEDLPVDLKGVYGGDLFPSATQNILSICGVYIDTLILPDPFLKTKPLLQFFSDKRKVYFVIKHALNLLQYRRAALAELCVPMIVVLPPDDMDDENLGEFYRGCAENDALQHSQKLFGQHFESLEDLHEFVKDLDTPQKVVAAAVDCSRILFDTSWSPNPEVQIENALKGEPAKVNSDGHSGLLVVNNIIGRMGVANELLLRSRRLCGSPVLDIPTSWKYLTWKMEYDAGKFETKHNLTDLHIARGLGDLASNEAEWLGRVPIDVLIEMRKEGVLHEIRELLGRGIGNIAQADPMDFGVSRDALLKNIDDAFKQHKENVIELRKHQLKITGRNIAPWIVKGSAAIAAAVIGGPTFGLVALAANEIVGGPIVSDLPNGVRRMIDEHDKLRRSPVGLLFSVSNEYV